MGREDRRDDEVALKMARGARFNIGRQDVVDERGCQSR